MPGEDLNSGMVFCSNSFVEISFVYRALEGAEKYGGPQKPYQGSDWLLHIFRVPRFEVDKRRICPAVAGNYTVKF
jgi:hypothetical protein